MSGSARLLSPRFPWLCCRRRRCCSTACPDGWPRSAWHGLAPCGLLAFLPCCSSSSSSVTPAGCSRHAAATSAAAPLHHFHCCRSLLVLGGGVSRCSHGTHATRIGADAQPKRCVGIGDDALELSPAVAAARGFIPSKESKQAWDASAIRWGRGIVGGSVLAPVTVSEDAWEPPRAIERTCWPPDPTQIRVASNAFAAITIQQRRHISPNRSMSHPHPTNPKPKTQTGVPNQ